MRSTTVGCSPVGGSSTGYQSIVRAEHLIPLKARAWLDLGERRRQGASIDLRDIRKHRNDVLRLTAIIDPGYAVVVPPAIRADMEAFVAGLPQEQLELSSLGIAGVSLAEVVDLLRNRFCA